MDWKDVAKSIAKGAPMLGNIVGNFVPGASAIGNLAGGAVGMVCSALGVDMSEPNAPDLVEAAIKADPEALLKLKQIESENEQHLREMNLKMMSLQVDERKLEVDNTKDARRREIEVRKAGGSNALMYILGAVICIGFFFLCYAVFRWKLPEGQAPIAYMLFGALTAAFGSVVQYFYGSSKGSNDKTKMLAQAQPIQNAQRGLDLDVSKFLEYIKK